MAFAAQKKENSVAFRDITWGTGGWAPLCPLKIFTYVNSCLIASFQVAHKGKTGHSFYPSSGMPLMPSQMVEVQFVIAGKTLSIWMAVC